METSAQEFRILSIDAWRGMENGWDWNNWHLVGTAPTDTVNLTARRLFAWMRREGYLSQTSAGRVAMEDDGYNVVIVDRSDRRPLLAIEYGSHV